MTTARGGRPATGSIKWRKNTQTGVTHWHVRLTLADGSRSPWVPLDPSIPEADEARARECARDVSAEARARGIVPEATGETVEGWFKRFHNAKESKGLSTVGDMRGRAKNWILPGIETKDVRAIGREDIEAIVRRLDRAVAAFVKDGPGEGRLAPASAANVWGDITHAFDEAVSSKDASLRVLSMNPTANVRGPDSGAERQGQILYSDEIRALLVGRAVDPDGRDVPLYRRIDYAVAIYTKGRASELEALTADDVDLAHGTITISKQVDRKSKSRTATKKTKTKRVRTIDIEPHVRPLIEWLVKHPQGKGQRLLRMPPPEDRAELLRKDLRTVGVKREALFVESDPLRRAVVFHDLRDTGLTHMAVRGDSPIVIQWAGGHTDFKTTQGYIDRGRVEARRIGEPLPPLPPELLEGFGSVSDRTETHSRKPSRTPRFSATPTGLEPVLPA